jgi:xylulokinase
VPERLLPRIVEPWEVVGEVTREAAAATGLRPGTPVAAGCGDTAAGLLGAGVVRPGVALDVAGSASVLATCVGSFRPDIDGRTLFTARTALEGVHYVLAYVQGGGLNLGWFRDAFAPDLVARHGDGAFAALDAEAAVVPPLADGVAFVPHLGGRVTPNDPYLRGTITGFGWGHDRGHVYRALLEAVALEFGLFLRATRALHGDLGDVVVRAVGGGAASALWGQVKADVLGAPYRPLLRQEGGALGSALLAGRAVGLVEDVAAQAERSNATATGVDPDPERHAAYVGAVDAYAELLRVASDLGRSRAARAGSP